MGPCRLCFLRSFFSVGEAVLYCVACFLEGGLKIGFGAPCLYHEFPVWVMLVVDAGSGIPNKGRYLETISSDVGWSQVA